MGEGRPLSTPVSTPETMENHEGGAASTHGANTNLDPSVQGGPVSADDRSFARKVEQEHAQDITPE